MNAVILAHPHDIKLFNKKDENLRFYAYNYHTYQELRKDVPKISYINDKLNLKSYDDFSIFVCRNWFKKNRDKNLRLQKISLGNIIHARLINEFSNLIKNYILIKKILSCNTKIFFPQQNTIYIRHILELFPNKIKFYKSSNNLQSLLLTNNLKSQIIPLPRIHKYSKLAKLIQYIFFQKKINKILYYPEPRTKSFFSKFANILSLNSVIPWKSFYFNLCIDYNKKVKSIIDFNYLEDLNQFIDANQNTNNQNFFLILRKCINSIIKNNKKNILRTLAIYFELYETYKPRAIILPGVLNFDYAVALELAKIKKIKTLIALDGILTNYCESEYNENYIFDKILAWGNENKILLKNHNIRKKDIILSNPYLKKTLVNSNKSRKYIIVLPLYHYSNKVSAHSDKCPHHTIDILKTINNLGKNKIILKLKKGNYNLDFEENIYKKYIKKYNLMNIIIRKDNIENILNDAKYIIGQCSTVIYEATVNNIPYHVYEPYDLGLSLNDIKKSNLLNASLVSRTKKQLIANLSKKNKSSLNKSKKQIFKGINLKKIF